MKTLKNIVAKIRAMQSNRSTSYGTAAVRLAQGGAPVPRELRNSYLNR